MRKRQVYESNTIQMMVLSRATTGGTHLIYTVYKNFLSMSDFAQLLKEIRTKTLEDKGYVVSRIEDDSNEHYIFRISWENIDILANIDQGAIETTEKP